MAEKYTGRTDDKHYKGAQVDITYSLKRCIHAAECTTRLAKTFDVKKRPWINADGASAEQIAEVIQVCPSGALHYEAKDDELHETSPSINRIIAHSDGYLQFIGNLVIQGANVQIDHETRATLCRCGASENKPFCDNAHKTIDFVTPELIVVKHDETADQGGQLVITAHKNGSYKVVGNLQIEDEHGTVIFTGSKTWLCRCGGSNKKPFCDSTHNKNGFTAE